MSTGTFDLDAVCDLITKHGFRRVALQFPDEFLVNCISIYSYIINRISNEAVEVFIIGDSTYGSSIDDISAQHVDSDVLIYFGSDLSSSGSIPVIVVPFSKDIDFESCTQQFLESLTHHELNNTAPVLLLYELSYSKAIRTNQSNLGFQCLNNLIVAELPEAANLTEWDPKTSQLPSIILRDNRTKVGGLLASSELLNNPDLVIWYIGEKDEQLVSINIRMSEHLIVSYNPDKKQNKSHKGCESKEFRERYGGLLRVKDANIIGIIVGSMGLNGDVTQAIVSRLESLIAAAGKDSYVFVMGRLNEAKLCNFPEIDIFCLISNEDVALIKPKTFHVPVVTPWEIELGLGGRDWMGIFRSDSASILSDVSLEDAIKKVIASLPENPIDSDSDNDIGDMEDIRIDSVKSVKTEIRLDSQVKSVDTAAVESVGGVGGAGVGSEGAAMNTLEATENTTENTKTVTNMKNNVKYDDIKDDIKDLNNNLNDNALTLLNSERSIIAFSSPAAEYFHTREFQGLLPIAPEGQVTAVQPGQFGIAATYKKYGKTQVIE